MKVIFCVVASALLTITYRTRPADNPDNRLQHWRPPSPDTIPQGPLGDSIRLGRVIFTQTPKYARAYVGDQQSCSDCHLAAGTAPFAAPVVGLPGLFPTFNKRANRVITLAERSQECFLRSENGRPLPYEGPEMTALFAYMQWLSQGQPTGQAFPGRGLVHLPELPPNVQHWRACLYATVQRVPWQGRRWHAAGGTSGVGAWGLQRRSRHEQRAQHGSIRPAQHAGIQTG
jgi:cytochrome c